jgi:hypothetical protein
MKVEPADINLGEIEAGTIAKASFNIKNEGNARFSGIIRTDFTTMSLSSARFDVDDGQTITVTCTIDTGKLETNNPYMAIANIFAGNGQTAAVQISFQVKPKPGLFVSPEMIDFGNVRYGHCKQEFININKSDVENQTGTIATTAQWLEIEPKTFSGDIQKILVTANTSLLEPNKEYQAIISIKLGNEKKTVKAIIMTCLDCN